MTHNAIPFVLVLVAITGACSTPAPRSSETPGAAGSALQYRWVADNPSDSGVSLLRRGMEGDTSMLAVTAPFVTLADVDSIVVRTQDDGDATVAAVMRADARDRLQTVTRQHVGSQVAVVVDGSVVTVAKVNSELSSVLPIATRSAAEAAQLAEQLRQAQAKR
jgi:preprotein translocase subunit SecD